ncbi:MAG: LPS export ABC transporter permease LptF, partial [Acidisphaera sp.]|nr:LPS export ABC transporter permease LptF [Acidisphaera sp.]
MHRMRSRTAPAGPVITRVDRYVFRQVLATLLAVTVGLVALIWLSQSLRFVELVVNRGLSARVFLQLTSLLIPGLVAVILPITTFTVVQFVYQRLAGDRELTVMRAAGLSPWRLARPALAVATLSVIACYVLNLWIVPASATAFRQYQFEIRNRVAAFLLQEGVFTPVADDLTVYVRARDNDGTLHGILIDDARDKNNRSTILAQSGRLIPAASAPRVLLMNGTRQEIDRQTGRLRMVEFSQYTEDLTDTGKLDETRYRDATEMSLSELLHPEGRVQPRDYAKLLAEAHKRLSSPLTAISFTLVALVASLMGTFRRHGNILRPLMGVMVIVGLLALGLMVGNLAARYATLMPLVWIQAIFPGVIAGW